MLRFVVEVLRVVGVLLSAPAAILMFIYCGWRIHRDEKDPNVRKEYLRRVREWEDTYGDGTDCGRRRGRGPGSDH
jgi:hypothetical protein